LFAAGAGAVLGALHNRVDLSKIPLSSTLTVPGVLGIGLFVGSKIIKTGTAGQILRHGATGMLSIAAYELAKEHLAGEKKPTAAGWDDFYGDEDEIFEGDI
jgi:xanthosine utilization system XapX-like protein